MTDAKRPEPFFVADALALDFLNSVAAPWGSEIEWLGGGRDLLAWLRSADLVPDAVLIQFQESAAPEALDAVAAQARDLREWFRGFVRDHSGRPLNPKALADLKPINRVLARDENYAQIEARALSENIGDASGRALRWRRERRWHSPNALLLPLAEAMGSLICEAEFARVKHCEGPSCTMWFHDVSKNHTRRWCSMAVCGNRVKAAAHRAKKRSARAGEVRPSG